MGRWSAALVIAMACASQTPAQRADQAPAAAPEPQVTVKVDKDDDFAAGFSPERPTPMPNKPQVKQPPPPEDARAAFRQALAELRRGLNAKPLPAGEKVIALVSLASGLTGDERSDAAAVAFQYAMARKDAAAAERAAREWRKVCGPQHIEACLKKANAALSSVAAMNGADAKKIKASVTALNTIDACVEQTERSKTAPPCVREADRLAVLHREMIAGGRLRIQVALLETNPTVRVEKLKRVQAECTAVPCAFTRAKALSALAKAAEGASDTDAATSWRLREMSTLAHAALPTERPWMRPNDIEAMCAKYDAAHQPGACRVLEQQLTGSWTFKDFSKQKSGDELPAAIVKQVNDHYAPLLQQCMKEHAKRLTPPDYVDVHVRWMVFNDGRVGEVHLGREEEERGPLMECVRRQFELWRYPRYEGEWQHVTQSFGVKAVDRMSASR